MPDGIENVMTVPMVWDKSKGEALQQVFDLLFIRAAYIECTVTALDADGVQMGDANPGDYIVTPPNVEVSRDGVHWSAFIDNDGGDIGIFEGAIVLRLATLTPRYIRFTGIDFYTFDGGGAVYPSGGAEDPTFTLSIAVEYS